MMNDGSVIRPVLTDDGFTLSLRVERWLVRDMEECGVFRSVGLLANGGLLLVSYSDDGYFDVEECADFEAMYKEAVDQPEPPLTRAVAHALGVTHVETGTHWGRVAVDQWFRDDDSSLVLSDEDLGMKQ